jgi:lipopolysaccharide heptosyltransferase II
VIGDVVFTTPLVAALRRTFPDARLTYLVEPAAAPVVHASPHLDDIIVSDRRRGAARVADDLTLGRRLRHARFDVAIDLHGGPRSALLTWATGAAMRIGYAFPARRWAYTHTVARPREPLTRHSVLNQWDLLAPLGIGEPPGPASHPLEMTSAPRETERMAARLAALGVTPDAALALVHVSASNPFKRWPPDSFAQAIAALLARRPGLHALVVSGPSEPEAAERIAAAARARLGGESHRVAAVAVGLAELRALASRAQVYIGGDTGPLHVAATTRTPIVEILGPTVAARSFPWRDPGVFAAVIEPGPLPCRPCDERTCAPGDYRCLTSIAPERVVEAAERALASADRPA